MRVHGTETLSTCLTSFHIRRPVSDISLNFNLCDTVVWNRKESVKSLNFNLSHEKPSTHMCGCYARGIKWKNINFSFEKRILNLAAIIEASTVEFLSSHLLVALCFLWRRSSARSSERWDCVECRGWNVFRVIRIAQIFLLVFLWHFVVALFMCDDSEKDENYHREKKTKRKKTGWRSLPVGFHRFFLFLSASHSSQIPNSSNNSKKNCNVYFIHVSGSQRIEIVAFFLPLSE